MSIHDPSTPCFKLLLVKYCQPFSVIVLESLVKSGGERRSTVWVVWVSCWSWGEFEWLSLNHHGDGNVVVVGWILNFSSISFSNGLKGVVSNDLSEGLEGNAVNNIERIGWGNLQGKSSLLIDWNRNELRVCLEGSGIIFGKSGGSVAKVLMRFTSDLN